MEKLKTSGNRKRPSRQRSYAFSRNAARISKDPAKNDVYKQGNTNIGIPSGASGISHESHDSVNNRQVEVALPLFPSAQQKYP
jgi:hypothetical protein